MRGSKPKKKIFITYFTCGFDKIEIKRRSVENENKEYILILDKDYTEFLEKIKKVVN